jgi:Ca2+-binding RTX toxin-like protein
MKPSKLRVLTSTTNRAFLLSLLSLAACSGNVPSGSSEIVGSTDQALLAAACDTTGGNLALTVGSGDVAYIGRIAGCTVEPCVYANAKDSSGNLCTVSSVGKTISVTGDGTAAHVEKVVFDFSNGLFAVASTTPLMSVALDGTGATSASKVMVIPPLTGGAMALGVNGLDINASTKRGTTQHLDMTIAGLSTDPAPQFTFNGGVGADAFTGDVGTVPTGFATSAVLTPVVGAATTLNLTISGGAGADILAGGAGSNTLLGGAGNDIFLQGTNVHAESIQGGDGVDTVDYSGRTLPVFVTPNSSTGITSAIPHTGALGTGYVTGDTVRVGGGTSGLSATLLVTAASGAITALTVMNPGDGYATATAVALTSLTGVGTAATIDTTAAAANDGQSYQPAGVGSAVPAEGDTVASDVEIINGGAANDILNAHAVAVTDVVLIGNGGDDKLTGGAGNDDLCGGGGNDTFYENPGNDNIVGGAGTDTEDYSTGTAVVACLNVADTAATKTCTAQNGGKFSGVAEQDLVNGVLAKVCPRATLNVDAAGTPALVAPTTPGGPMTVDVENLTGNATAANTLQCGTLACTVFGGTAADVIVGSPLSDQLFGLGGADTFTGNGGNDLVDLTGTVAGASTVDCGGNAVTILKSSTNTLTGGGTNCASANIP